MVVDEEVDEDSDLDKFTGFRGINMIDRSFSYHTVPVNCNCFCHTPW